VEPDREWLRTLGRGLTQLHSLLLDRERRAYESRHGAVGSPELLQLLLGDEQFRWLRRLSGLMARVDELADTDGPIAADDTQAIFRDVTRLLKSGDRGAFQDKYREALQESPDVVIEHARISDLLRR